MADLDLRFPPAISFNAVGGPGFLTNVSVMASGQESRNQEWEFDRGEWEVSHAARMPSAYRPLIAFFVNCAGRANTFRFKDWVDFECAPGEGFFVSSGPGGSPATLRMVKHYVVGGFTYVRIIRKPVSGTIAITGGGTLDYATGLITGGAPTAWHGEFDCKCRFDIDRMRRATINRSPETGELIVGWDSIPIVEVFDE